MKQFIIAVILSMAVVALSYGQEIELLSNEQLSALTSTQQAEIATSLEDCKVLAEGQNRLPQYVALNLRVTKKFIGANMVSINKSEYSVPQIFKPFKDLGITEASNSSVFIDKTVIMFDRFTGLYCFKKQYVWEDGGLFHIVSFVIESTGNFVRIEEELFDKQHSIQETYWVSPITIISSPVKIVSLTSER